MEALIPGEPRSLETLLPEDVEHWLAVYRELLLMAASISPSYAARLGWRLAYWEKLAAETRPTDEDGQLRAGTQGGAS